MIRRLRSGATGSCLSRSGSMLSRSPTTQALPAARRGCARSATRLLRPQCGCDRQRRRRSTPGCVCDPTRRTRWNPGRRAFERHPERACDRRSHSRTGPAPGARGCPPRPVTGRYRSSDTATTIGRSRPCTRCGPDRRCTRRRGQLLVSVRRCAACRCRPSPLPFD